MTSILPQKENLKKHEIIIPALITLLLVGLINGIATSGRVSSSSLELLFYISSGIWIMCLPITQVFIKIRFTRLYNTLIWVIPATILFGIYYWVNSNRVLMQDPRPDLLTFLRLPLFSLIFKHIMRLIHLLIYKCEPLSVVWWGPLITDEDARWEEISSDKAFTFFDMLGYVIILWIVYI